MTTERSHDLKFDKGTIYIVYFHTHVHVHIEKMGNLSKSKIKLYICDNKLRSCKSKLKFYICDITITSCAHVRNLHLGANVHPGANFLHRICTTYKGGANSHPGANLNPDAFS